MPDLVEELSLRARELVPEDRVRPDSVIGGRKRATATAVSRRGGCPRCTSIEVPPGLREGKLGAMYLAYVRDPDGNKLCALHRPK